MANHNSTVPRFHFPDLDVLRGLAAILMITNHLGVKILAQDTAESGITGLLLLIGSFAPVLFFFVTGVGYGLQSSKSSIKPYRWVSILSKVGILLVADLLMQWSQGRLLGLDFLGFIGLSILLLEVLRNSRRALLYCLVGSLFFSLCRYGIGPLVKSLGYANQLFFLDWIFGTQGLPGVSYPLTPWIVYPLVGYIVGVAVTRYGSLIEAQRIALSLKILAVGLLPALASLFLVSRGAPFFRWGTVSLAFYIASFMVIAVGMAAVLCICSVSNWRFIQQGLALRGIPSLAIVPIHYFLIEVLINFGFINVNPWMFGVTLIGVTGITFLLARYVETLSRQMAQIEQQRLLWVGLIMMVGILACLTLISSQPAPFLSMAARTIGQLLLCGLLSLSISQRVASPKFST